MTRPFGQVVTFTSLARSPGGAGTTDGAADEGEAGDGLARDALADDDLAAFGGAVLRRVPDFFLAMAHAGDLILGRGNDAIGLADQ
jgi:hypothetical protein